MWLIIGFVLKGFAARNLPEVAWLEIQADLSVIFEYIIGLLVEAVLSGMRWR